MTSHTVYRPDAPQTPGRRGRRVALVTVAVVVGAFVALAALGAALDGTASQDSPAATATTTATPAASPAARLSAAIRKALGGSNRDGVTRVAVDYGATLHTLDVTWAINENLTAGLTKDTARLEAIKIIGAVKGTHVPVRVLTITGTYAMTDDYGTASEDTVIVLGYTGKVLKAINAKTVSYKKITDLADRAHIIVPAFRY